MTYDAIYNSSAFETVEKIHAFFKTYKGDIDSPDPLGMNADIAQEVLVQYSTEYFNMYRIGEEEYAMFNNPGLVEETYTRYYQYEDDDKDIERLALFAFDIVSIVTSYINTFCEQTRQELDPIDELDIISILCWEHVQWAFSPKNPIHWEEQTTPS